MSKKHVPSNSIPATPDAMGYLYYPWMISDLEGQILTAVESFGLKDTQEKAAKDVIRSFIYRFYDRVKYVPMEQLTEIEKYHANPQNGVPTKG